MATLGSSRLLLSLARQSRKHLLSSNKQISTAPVALYWNKDWKPAPIPKTPEERAAAAKKYGLRPEDYNVLEEGEIGDYPNLPLVAQSVKDPFEAYDMPGERRNYGEPMHADWDLMGYDLYDPKSDGLYTYWQQLGLAVLTFCGFLGLYIFFSPYPVTPPEMPKQYPFNNLYLEKGGEPANEPEIKHYTFNPPCTC